MIEIYLNDDVLQSSRNQRTYGNNKHKGITDLEYKGFMGDKSVELE